MTFAVVVSLIQLPLTYEVTLVIRIILCFSMLY